MPAVIRSLLGALRSALRGRAGLAIENVALRQQFANLRRTSSLAPVQHRPLSGARMMGWRTTTRCTLQLAWRSPYGPISSGATTHFETHSLEPGRNWVLNRLRSNENRTMKS